jgi:hypothetical protein
VQVDEYWGKFVAAGGTPVACGWITDHFGVSWQIDPKLLIDLINNPATAPKAMQAMMRMVIIDSAALERAVKGYPTGWKPREGTTRGDRTGFEVLVEGIRL